MSSELNAARIGECDMTKRSFAHWTPRYVMDRAMQMLWMRRNPEAPWLSRQAVQFLAQWLSSGDQAIEWGSGRSTVWLARRVGHLVSMEHDPEWFGNVSVTLRRQNLTNVDYHLTELTGETTKDAENYSLRVLEDIADGSIDFVLVDGIFRDRCAMTILDKLRPGGLLVVDDAHRYLPSNSRSQFAIPTGGCCASEQWEQFLAATRKWHQVWFSDGIYHDAFYFKPEGGR